MKLRLNLRTVLVLSGILLGVIAFFICFAAGIKQVDTGVSIKGLIIGPNRIVTSSNSIEPEYSAHATLSLILIITGLFTLFSAAIVSLFVKNEKVRRLVIIICGVLLVAAAVGVFVCKLSYTSSVVKKWNLNKDIVKAQFDQYKINGAVIFAGIMFILSGGCIVTSELACK